MAGSSPARATVAPRPSPTSKPESGEPGRYLALEDAEHLVAISIANVRRILAFRSGALTGDATDVVEVDGDVLPVLELRRWFGWQGTRAAERRLVVVDDATESYGVVVDRSLAVFSVTKDELRSARSLGNAESNGIVGFCPWSKLADYLVRGAVPANVLARAMISRLGRLRVEGDRLWAGNQLLNLDETIVDAVLAATGYGCTIFLDNVRIATTATTAGSRARALGTRTNQEVTEGTLRRGLEFRGVTRTIGKDWAIVYHPLRDEQRVIVGMVATYREVSSRLLPVVDVSVVKQALARRDAAAV